MPRLSLLFLAFAACGSQSADPKPALPSPPIRVSTTPMAPGEVVTLSVELQQPAGRPLDVQFYGSGKGAGKEPCVHDGAVCGGLAAPVHLGTARFFADMKITSVDAATPSKAAPDSTWLIQAFVEWESGAVASEVLPVVVQARKAATTGPATTGGTATTGTATTGSATLAPPTAVAPVERPATEAGGNCDREPTPNAVASCRALATRDIGPCEHIEPLDDKIYCFGMARRSGDACSQIQEPGLRERCFEALKALAAP